MLIICGLHGYACVQYLNVRCNATDVFTSSLSDPGQPKMEPHLLLSCDYWTTTLLILMGIFSLWVFLLLTTQLWMNVIEGATTNESINFKRYAMGNSYPVHGHSHGGKGGHGKKCKNAPVDDMSLVERGKKAAQYMPLKMSISARFMDLFHLRRRNIDWSKSYTEDDLVAGGLMKRVLMEV